MTASGQPLLRKNLEVDQEIEGESSMTPWIIANEEGAFQSVNVDKRAAQLGGCAGAVSENY